MAMELGHQVSASLPRFQELLESDETSVALHPVEFLEVTEKLRTNTTDVQWAKTTSSALYVPQVTTDRLDCKWPTVKEVSEHITRRYRYPYVVLSTKLSIAAPMAVTRDSVPDRTWEDAPSLVKRTMLLNLLYPDTKTVLVVTSLSKVPYVINLLRTYHHMKLVGSSIEDNWLDRAVDYIVTCPEDICNHCHGMYVGAAVFDEECREDMNQAIRWLECFMEFSGLLEADGSYFPLAPIRARWKNWLTPCVSLGPALLEMIKMTLPEAAECPGLGDAHFERLVETFARRPNMSIFSRDWSGVVGLMPGLLRGIDLENKTGPIVIAPAGRVAALTQLLEFFVQYMGLVDVVVAADSLVSLKSGQRAHVVVGTVECLFKLLVDASGRERKVTKVVVVQPEQVEAEKLEHVLELLTARGAAQVAFAAAENKELLARSVPPSKTAFIMPAKVTMARVQLFKVAVVSVEAKVDKLVEIWQRLGRLMTEKWSVVCNSPDAVEELASLLEKRDVPVCVIHSRMEAKAVEERKREFDHKAFHVDALVLTDVCDRRVNRTDVIMYELPHRVEEYVKSCGNKHKSPGKVVINLVASGQEEKLLQSVCDLHSLTLKPLPENCNKRLLKKCRMQM